MTELNKLINTLNTGSEAFLAKTNNLTAKIRVIEAEIYPKSEPLLHIDKHSFYVDLS